MRGLRFNLLVIACICCVSFNKTVAQQKMADNTGFQDTLLHKRVYTYAQQLPEPKGGPETLLKQLSKKIKFPPGDADYAGKVIVAFVIEPNSEIDGERVIREPSGNKQIFSKQIFAIVKTIKWKPAKRNGKAVPFLYTLPITIDIGE